MNLHRLDLVSLSLFLQVADSGSISGGAERARLAVGAASRRITDLEAGLGTPLLERHSRGVTLTPAGRALRDHARRILADVDHLAADLSDHAAGLVGVVRVWANTSAVTQFLPEAIAGFLQREPGIRLELEEADSDAVVLAVLDGRADLGLFADRTRTLGLQTLPWREDRLVLVLPQGHALARRAALDFAEVADEDFVSLSAGTSLAQRLLAESAAAGRRLKVRIQVRSFDAMCRMVAAGLGVAVLPEAAVGPHLRSMALRAVPLRDAWARRVLLAGARDLAALPRPVRAWLDHLMASAAEARRPASRAKR